MNVAFQTGNDNNIDEYCAQKGGISTNSVRTINGINGFYCATVTLKTTAGSFPDTLIVNFGSVVQVAGTASHAPVLLHIFFPENWYARNGYFRHV